MSWKCHRCGRNNKDDDAAICGDCRKPNPGRDGKNPFTPEHQWLGRVTCPHCGYSNTNGRVKDCYKCGRKLRPGS